MPIRAVSVVLFIVFSSVKGGCAAHYRAIIRPFSLSCYVISYIDMILKCFVSTLIFEHYAELSVLRDFAKTRIFFFLYFFICDVCVCSGVSPNLSSIKKSIMSTQLYTRNSEKIVNELAGSCRTDRSRTLPL